MKKLLFITLLPIAIGIMVYLFYFQSDDHVDKKGEKQLYSCGMHPQIISEEPGLCPICEMQLTPIKNNGKNSSREKEILYWKSSMDATEIYDKPGKDKMGMELVPVYSADEQSGVIAIDPVIVQNMNVQTHSVEKRKLNSSITTNGVLAINESAEYKVTTRIDGWIEKLFINYAGQVVDKGDKLMDIYSPELVSAQQELITAISYREKMNSNSSKIISSSNEEIVSNAKKKLKLLGLEEEEIERIIKTKEAKTVITLFAQKRGTVLEKNILEGEKIQAGMPLLKIADLSSLWLLADIYETEIAKIFLGAKAEVEFNFLPGKKYFSTLSFVYPTLDSKSRTVKLRFNINNSGELKPSMFASIKIEGKNLGEQIVIPENGVIRSGSGAIVIVALGEGKFKPQQITLGASGGGFVQALQGLTAGLKIVTSAQFLIDSESNLREAINKFQLGGHDHSTIDEKKKSGDEKNSANKNEKQDAGTKPKQTEHNHDLPHEYKGAIDVDAIDSNEDGKLWQCPMDWNVLSDKSGRCPICNMKLKEYSLEEIKQNLMKHGFNHK